MADLAVNLVGFGLAFVFLLASVLFFASFLKADRYDWRGDIDVLLCGVCLGAAIVSVVWAQWMIRVVL